MLKRLSKKVYKKIFSNFFALSLKGEVAEIRAPFRDRGKT